MGYISGIFFKLASCLSVEQAFVKLMGLNSTSYDVLRRDILVVRVGTDSGHIGEIEKEFNLVHDSLQDLEKLYALLGDTSLVRVVLHLCIAVFAPPSIEEESIIVDARLVFDKMLKRGFSSVVDYGTDGYDLFEFWPPKEMYDWVMFDNGSLELLTDRAYQSPRWVIAAATNGATDSLSRKTYKRMQVVVEGHNLFVNMLIQDFYLKKRLPLFVEWGGDSLKEFDELSHPVGMEVRFAIVANGGINIPANVMLLAVVEVTKGIDIVKYRVIIGYEDVYCSKAKQNILNSIGGKKYLFTVRELIQKEGSNFENGMLGVIVHPDIANLATCLLAWNHVSKALIQVYSWKFHCPVLIVVLDSNMSCVVLLVILRTTDQIGVDDLHGHIYLVMLEIDLVGFPTGTVSAEAVYAKADGAIHALVPGDYEVVVMMLRPRASVFLSACKSYSEEVEYFLAGFGQRRVFLISMDFMEKGHGMQNNPALNEHGQAGEGNHDVGKFELEAMEGVQGETPP